MKKLFASIFFLVLSAGITLFANDSDLFKLDYSAVKAEFSQLDQLETMVTSNADVTYSNLMLTNSGLVASMRLVPESLLPGGDKYPVLGIPSFLWGCGLGIVGMLCVYIISDQDKVETKKALWGCITWTLVGSVLYWGALGGALGGM